MNLTEDITFEKVTDSTSKPALVPQNRIEAKKYLAPLTEVAEVVQIIIDFYGKPASISSGYRGKTLNTAIGSKTTASQHIYGEALDFSIIGVPVWQVYQDICERKIPNLPYDKLGQVILEKYKTRNTFTWVHISIFTERYKAYRIAAGKSHTPFALLVTEDSSNYSTYEEYKPKLAKLFKTGIVA